MSCLDAYPWQTDLVLAYLSTAHLELPSNASPKAVHQEILQGAWSSDPTPELAVVTPNLCAPVTTGQPRKDVAIRRPDAQRLQCSLESTLSTMHPIDVDGATRATTSCADPLPSPDPPAIGAAEDQMEDGRGGKESISIRGMMDSRLGRMERAGADIATIAILVEGGGPLRSHGRWSALLL